MASKSLLGNKLAGGALVASPASSVSVPSKLSKHIAAGRRGEFVELASLGRVRIELPGAVLWNELEAANRKAMVPLFGDLAVENAQQYELDHARRVLAEGVRNPDDFAQAFGTLEEWGALDVDVINEAWQAFGDVRERLDPIAHQLSTDEMFAISSAVKKKDGPLLRTFGVVKLSAWLVTTDDLPLTSSTPSLPNSDSSSERSE